MLADTDDHAAVGLDSDRLRRLWRREAADFSARRPRSAALLEQARLRMPSGVPMAWMAGLSPHEPIFASHGEGPRFWDVDGNEQLDFNLCDLSAPAGFTPAPILRAIREQSERGLQFLLPTEDALVVCDELERRFGLPRWQFTLAASTANVEALRLARVATGRERVIQFGGRYHGHIDDSLAGGGSVDALGLAPGAGRATAVVDFNDADAVERELELGGVAAIITEPVLTNCTLVLPQPGFLERLRELCDRHGALLILDETHTQFAVYGGGTRRFGLRPDIVTGGKGIGGGVPIGVYGMTIALAEVMERGLERDSTPEPGIATGGTLFGNPLSLAAARAGLTEVLTAAAFGELERLGARLADGIDAAIAARGLPWRAHRFGGRSGFCLFPELPRTGAEGDASISPLLCAARKAYMANRGVWDAIATAGPSISTAHREEDVDRYLEVLDGFLVETAG